MDTLVKCFLLAIVASSELQLTLADPLRPPSVYNVPTGYQAPEPSVEDINPQQIPNYGVLLGLPCQCQVPQQTSNGLPKNQGGANPQLTPEQAALLELILRLLLLQKLNEYAQMQNTDPVENVKFGALVGNGITGDASISASLGTTGTTADLGTNTFLGSGTLGNGILGTILNSANNLATVGNNILATKPTLANLLSQNGLLTNLLTNSGTGTGTNTGANNFYIQPGVLANLLTNLGLNTANNNIYTQPGLLSNLLNSGSSGANNLLNQIIGPNGLGSGTGILGTNLLTGIKPTLAAIKPTLSFPGLSGLLSNLGFNGGVPIGTSGGLANLLGLGSNGGLSTTGTNNGVTVTGLFGPNGLIAILNSILSGNIQTSTGRLVRDFRTQYSRSIEEAGEADNELPWIATVYVNGEIVASGVLISDQHVLTVAAPLINAQTGNIVVSLGSNDRCSASTILNMTISSITINPQYDDDTKAHDLTLLKLVNKVTLGKQILPICLPSILSPYKNSEVTVPSWGESFGGEEVMCTPKSSRLPLLSSESCSNSTSPANLVTEDKACLGTMGRDGLVCSASPGTAVQCLSNDGRHELLGIISHSKVCGKSDTTLFVKIHNHLPWILRHIVEDDLCMKL